MENITSSTPQPTFITPDITPNRPKRKVFKIILIIALPIIVLIVIIVAIPFFLNTFFAKDIPTIDDSDLQLKNIEVADADNAYFDLAKVKDLSFPTSQQNPQELQKVNDMLAGKTWDDDLFNQLYSQNIHAISDFDSAASKPLFQDPALAHPSRTELPELTNLTANLNMAKISALHALYLAKLGKDKEAMDEALKSANIGQKIQSSQAIIIDYLVGASMKKTGLQTAQQILSQSKLDPNAINQYTQEMNQYYNNEDGFIASLKNEYYTETYIFELLKANRLKNEDTQSLKKNYYFSPNTTELLYANLWRTYINSIKGSCDNIDAINVSKISPNNFAQLYIERNAIGEKLYDIVADSNIKNHLFHRCDEDVLIGSTQTMFAMKAYKDKNGHYPNTLDDLVPGYLPSVPLDPYDNKELKYSVDKKIIYSIGKDLKDSGGSTGDDWSKMADPTFTVNF